MVPRKRPQPPPFSSFGWSLTGALLIALSLPPLGVYPLAWVALVPLIARWASRRPTLDYVRELYALLLTTACCVGFWLLFNPDASTAAMGGLSLFLVPLPLVAAFALAGVVRERLGLVPGLAALALNVVAAEFLSLTFSVTLPWLLLGHTQAGALEFIQMADIGGVLLLSLWVLLLNVTVFVALPRGAQPGERYVERGAAMAVFTALIALPVVYGSIRTAQADLPAGYTSVGIVQPGVSSRQWDGQSATVKVDHLADLSDSLLGRDTSLPDSVTAPVAPRRQDLALLVWPQMSLPFMGTDQGEAQLYRRLQRWTSQRGVALLAGAQTASDNVDRRRGIPDDRDLANSAVLIRPGKPLVQYDQMRRVPFADAEAAEGNDRVLFDADGTRLATAVGFESLFGNHIRKFTRSGADLIVVLSRNDLWGRSSGIYQHLQFTRLRAVESRRAVVLSTVGGISAMIYPNGEIEHVAGWMDQEVHAIQVPTFRGQTFYVRHGDWVGQWALVLALVLGVGGIGVSVFFPELTTAKRAAKRLFPA
ncbi:apolipoprotein N-acyltransferase [Rubrivirga sp. IMCC45206]|uniref:apolipoprotein N-acyltransferase n=1 Tax=Rubrivirga sp. IMCC45206 TaxID=3391614 RepID=UPI00398FE4C4